MKRSALALIPVLFLAGCQVSGEQPELPEPTDISAEQDTDKKTGVLEENVVYEQVAVNGLIYVGLGSGKGIELDLNGDGAAEQLYLSPKGIYIDGVLQAEPWKSSGGGTGARPWDGLWLGDIDSSDMFLNFIVGGEVDKEEIMMWYDGELKSAELENFQGQPFSTADYTGDGTFLVNSMLVPLLYQSCYRTTEYKWDAEKGIAYTGKAVTISEGPEDMMNLENPEDGQWKLIVDIKLFADCSADAQAVEVKGQQKVYPLKAIYKTSGTRFDDCWLLLETENGEQGWIYTENVDGRWIINKDRDAYEVIEGYSTAG